MSRESKLAELRILLISAADANAEAWRRMDLIELGAGGPERAKAVSAGRWQAAARDISASADRMNSYILQIDALEDASDRVRNEDLDADAKQMCGWNR